MPTKLTTERAALAARSLEEARRWRIHVDSLASVLTRRGGRGRTSPQLQSLRTKCDTFENKAAALRRHERRAWARARAELEVARADLRFAWRAALNALDRQVTSETSA